MQKIFVIFFSLIVFTNVRISSYKPGEDGFSGKRIAGMRALNLPKRYWNFPTSIPVCAMRAGKTKGKIRFGDIAEIRMKTKKGKLWKHQCIILDTGPWGCISKKGKWNNCCPRCSPYYGKLPKGWKWKSYVDIANSPNGYPGGGKGKIRVLHLNCGVKLRKMAVSRLLQSKKVVLKHESKTWKRIIKF